MQQGTDIIEYCQLTEPDLDQSITLVGRIMAQREPALSAFGVTVSETTQIFIDCKQVLLGLSTVAKINGKVVGCRFTMDWTDAPGPPPFPAAVSAMSKLWGEHDSNWAKNKVAAGGGEPIKRGEWAHWTGIVVHEDYERRGIGEGLYRENIALLKSKGYKGAVCENVSAFSAKAAVKAGARLVSSQEYATYEVDGAFPLAIIKPPHTEFKLQEIIF